MQLASMTQSQKRESALPRPFLLAGLIAPVLFTAVYLIDGATRPDYNPLVQWVSHLSLGPRGWLGTLNLAVAGVLTLACAQGLRQTLKPSKRARWAVRLVFLAGIGWLMGAAFPMDPNLGYPPGAKAANGSWHDNLHNLAAFLVVGAFVATPILLRAYFNRTWWKRYSIATSIGVLAGFIVCSALVTLDYAHVYHAAPSGLMERVALTLGFAWMGALAVLTLKDTE
jgi:uncharacterized membrane protein YhdT